MKSLLTHDTMHYSLMGLLICLCGYLSYESTAQMALFDKGTLHRLSAKDISELAQARFDVISDINLYGFLLLCASASVLYVRQHNITPFFANLVGYFVVLCILYFWLGDVLLAFKQTHGLWEGGFSASLIIVPMKLAMAGFMGYASYLLAKHIKAQRELSD